MSACPGSYTPTVLHFVVGRHRCAQCQRSWDRVELAGDAKRNAPLHSPQHYRDTPWTLPK